MESATLDLDESRCHVAFLVRELSCDIKLAERAFVDR